MEAPYRHTINAGSNILLKVDVNPTDKAQGFRGGGKGPSFSPVRTGAKRQLRKTLVVDVLCCNAQRITRGRKDSVRDMARMMNN